MQKYQKQSNVIINKLKILNIIVDNQVKRMKAHNAKNIWPQENTQ